MRHLQSSYVTGYVTILVKGQRPERFFQACMNEDIVVWNVKKTSKDSCKGNVKLQDISIIKKVKRNTHYKISFINKKGFPFILKTFFKRKEMIVSLLICLLLILFLSNILWKVSITGVSQEMEEKIDEQLKAYGIHQGTWTFNLANPSVIQQDLIRDLPELLWVGVQKKGTTFLLEGVEKTIVKRKPVSGPRHLVAAKKGIIKKMYVSKGIPLVQINDYVEPGDILVSGDPNKADEESEEEEKKDTKKKDLEAAEGEIFAHTWYEISVTVPLTANYELLTGRQEKKHYMQIGKINIPIWGFKNPDYEALYQEMHANPLYFLKWKLPINMVESIISEKEYNKVKRTKEEAVKKGITQAKHDLHLQLGPDARILTEKVLHETIENGKVNLKLYMTVEENIAKTETINQGD